jgi:hypothetical protein
MHSIMRYTLLITLLLIRDESFAFTFSMNPINSIIRNEKNGSNETIKWSMSNTPAMIPLLIFE